MLSLARGNYTNFLDDDDDVHDQYIEMIYQRIMRNPDVVELRGILTWIGGNPRTFIHSIQYNSYFEKNGVYYRPPNHLNTMKRSIAQSFLFATDPVVGNQGEDTKWAMEIARSKLLKTEEPLTIPYYFYRCKPRDY